MYSLPPMIIRGLPIADYSILSNVTVLDKGR
jgi:hypothetical protein